MKYKLICIFITAIFPLFWVNADTVITRDGSTLHGTITLIDKGQIHIDTKYAGKLQLKQNEVFYFETETPVVVRFENGSKSIGSVVAYSDGNLRIQSEDGMLETSTEKIAASWAPGDVDPEIARNSRKWLYDLAVDLVGKEGNTDKSYLGGDLDVSLKGPYDELRFAFEYEKGKQNGNQTDDRALGRIDYERFNKNKVGWYVRDVLETDKISDIYLRSTTGGGASYRLINNDFQTLVVRSGLGYRFTDFESEGRENESSATIEMALEHSYKFKELFYLENSLYYSPEIGDFGNYRATHDSNLKIPIGSGESLWIRIGIKNEYESETSAQEKLDTSYYTKLVYSWK